MKIIKVKIIVILLVSLITNNYCLAGGIPVFDGVAEANSLNQWQEKLTQWAEQAAYQEVNNKLSEAQVKAMKGIKLGNVNFNDVMNMLEKFDLTLPSYNSILNGKWSSEAEKISTKLDLDSICVRVTNKQLLNLCKADAMNTASVYAVNEMAIDNINTIAKNIQSMSTTAISSEDIKKSTDLNNMITSYNSQIATIDKKLAIAESQYQKNKQIIDMKKQAVIEQINTSPSNKFFKGANDNLRQKINSNSEWY